MRCDGSISTHRRGSRGFRARDPRQRRRRTPRRHSIRTGARMPPRRPLRRTTLPPPRSGRSARTWWHAVTCSRSWNRSRPRPHGTVPRRLWTRSRVASASWRATISMASTMLCSQSSSARRTHYSCVAASSSAKSSANTTRAAGEAPTCHRSWLSRAGSSVSNGLPSSLPKWPVSARGCNT
jgi:hypothetical protein